MDFDSMHNFFAHFDNRLELERQSQGQRFVGLLGESPSKNYSQNAAWDHLLKVFDLDVVYVPLDLGPSQRDRRETLKQIIADAESTAEVVGFKVAPPYKEHVFQLLETSAEGAARRLSTANTVAKRGQRLFCSNTDGLGMCHHLAEAFGPMEGKTCLILGAGGAAATISDALIQHARRILVAARNITKALELKRLLERHHPGKMVGTLLITQVRDVIGEVDCVINTTPVGRQGQLERFSGLASTEMPSEENAARSEEIIEMLRRPIWFASTLYRPEKELLLKQAEQRGHRVVNGLGMWIYQAAVAAQDGFFPDTLSDVPVSRLAAVLGQGLAAFEKGGQKHG